MRIASWGLVGSLVGLTACPPPLGEAKDPDAFELEIARRPLSGTVLGEPWSLLQSFALGDEATGYTAYLAPVGVTACDASAGLEEQVLTVEITELGLLPWGEGAEASLQLADGASVSTRGGGIDVELDPSGAYLEGGLVFDFDESTVLDGEFSILICQ